MKRLAMAALVACVAGIIAGSIRAQAQSISPSSVTATIEVGETLIIHKTITLGVAPAFIDLIFGSTLADAGLSLAFSCTDALGCTNVAGFQSRDFDLAITGVLPGVYDFDVFALGVPAVETDLITVLAAAPVPEPSTYALIILGLIALSAIRWRIGAV
jgi:hypothetical protein